jgi:hypothetical protein
MFAKRFFYVCAGILMLAVSYHFGATSATAQAGSNVTGITYSGAGSMFVLTGNGDLYSNSDARISQGLPASLVGNFWGGATPARATTFGAIKARYR